MQIYLWSLLLNNQSCNHTLLNQIHNSQSHTHTLPSLGPILYQALQVFMHFML